jgi:hypothetical protein
MMKNRASFIAIMLALFAAISAVPAVSEPMKRSSVAGSHFAEMPKDASSGVMLGETRYFQNWAAGCDNVLRCEAVAMLPPDFPAGMLSVVVSRGTSRDDALKINIFGFDSESDRYTLMVDGRLIDTGPITDDIAPISVVGKDALKLARALAKGNLAVVFDGAGKEIGKISLSGSAAALRYLDTKQRRAGTYGGMVARGKRKIRFKNIPLPIIAAPRLHMVKTVPETGDLVALAEGGSCIDDRVGVTQDSVYSLGAAGGKPLALALISCGGGAYNISSAAFIGTKADDGKWKFAPAIFDHDENGRDEKGNVNLVVNANWDATLQRLNTVNKGRGVGDCGHSADYVWDGSKFRLVHARLMAQCQGSLDWITVWRADVRLGG